MHHPHVVERRKRVALPQQGEKKERKCSRTLVFWPGWTLFHGSGLPFLSIVTSDCANEPASDESAAE